MRRLFPLVLSGLVAASFGQLAAAQSVGVQGPAGTGANVDLNKGGNTAVAPDVQNSQQVGGTNQSNQQHGTGNQAQNTEQRGAQNQSSSAGASSSQGKGYGKNRHKDKGDEAHQDSSASAGANAGSSKETGDAQARHDNNPADKAPKY
jgi:hypothetical protein